MLPLILSVAMLQLDYVHCFNKHHTIIIDTRSLARSQLAARSAGACRCVRAVILRLEGVGHGWIQRRRRRCQAVVSRVGSGRWLSPRRLLLLQLLLSGGGVRAVGPLHAGTARRACDGVGLIMSSAAAGQVGATIVSRRRMRRRAVAAGTGQACAA